MSKSKGVIGKEAAVTDIHQESGCLVFCVSNSDFVSTCVQINYEWPCFVSLYYVFRVTLFDVGVCEIMSNRRTLWPTSDCQANS